MLLTARKRIYVAVTVILKPHHFKGVIDFVGYFGFCEFARLFYRVTLFVRLYSVVKFFKFKPESYVFKNVEMRKKRVFLEYGVYGTAVRRHLRHVLPFDEYVAACGQGESRNHS